MAWAASLAGDGTCHFGFGSRSGADPSDTAAADERSEGRTRQRGIRSGRPLPHWVERASGARFAVLTLVAVAAQDEGIDLFHGAVDRSACEALVARERDRECFPRLAANDHDDVIDDKPTAWHIADIGSPADQQRSHRELSDRREQ